jgi:hypothetical protein
VRAFTPVISEALKRLSHKTELRTHVWPALATPPTSARIFAHVCHGAKKAAALELRAQSGTPAVEIVRAAFTDAGCPAEVNDLTLDASAYILRSDFDA